MMNLISTLFSYQLSVISDRFLQWYEKVEVMFTSIIGVLIRFHEVFPQVRQN
jgi:hypothetical protein